MPKVLYLVNFISCKQQASCIFYFLQNFCFLQLLFLAKLLFLANFISCKKFYLLHTLFHAKSCWSCKKYFMRLQNLAPKIFHAIKYVAKNFSCKAKSGKKFCRVKNLHISGVQVPGHVSANQRESANQRISPNQRITESCESSIFANHRSIFTRLFTNDLPCGILLI